MDRLCKTLPDLRRYAARLASFRLRQAPLSLCNECGRRTGSPVLDFDFLVTFEDFQLRRFQRSTLSNHHRHLVEVKAFCNTRRKCGRLSRSTNVSRDFHSQPKCVQVEAQV